MNLRPPTTLFATLHFTIQFHRSITPCFPSKRQSRCNFALAGPPPQGTSATQQWAIFCEAAWTKVDAKGATHPMAELKAHDSRRSEQLAARARALYGVLSGNIHEFCNGNISIGTDRWNVGDVSMLKSLLPTTAGDQEINWKNQRSRYGLEDGWGKSLISLTFLHGN
jgi:hypothetical protein